MDEGIGIDYSELLLPRALEQNPGVFLLSTMLTLWLLTYGQKGVPRGENKMTEELRVKRSTQRLNMVIIYMFRHIKNYFGILCVKAAFVTKQKVTLSERLQI